jgi:hypothetical protein
MATLPTSECQNRLALRMAPPSDGQPGCPCCCHQGTGQGCGPALGLRARPDTFGELLPPVRILIGQLHKLAEAGRLAEVDLCLLHILEDWIVLSRAEIDQASGK